MDTSDIRLIRTLAELGSLTRAADVLFMSQPTLSKKLGRLESKLQSKLFYRSATGVIPTEIGRYILEAGRTIENQVSRIERHVQHLVDLDHGDVRLGVGPIIEQAILPDVLPAFVSKTGTVQLSIVTEHADVLVERLYSSELDIIAGPFRPGDYHDLVGFPLIKDNLIMFARGDHPIFNADSESSLNQYPFASPAPQGSLPMLPLDFEFLGKRVTSENYPLLKNLILKSDCIGGAPRHLVYEELQQGSLREINTENSLVWESACLVKPESTDAPLVKLLVDLFVGASASYVMR